MRAVRELASRRRRDEVGSDDAEQPERVTRSCWRMINRAQEFRQRAQHCERARSLAVTLEARLMYFDLAQEWRELADQVEQLGERNSATIPVRPAAEPAQAEGIESPHGLVDCEV
jgi:hypothetical protein